MALKPPEIRLIYGSWQDSFCVIYKPQGMSVQHSHSNCPSVLEEAKKMVGDERKVFNVHRLDKNTQGLLVLAFDREIAKSLSISLEKGFWQKWYRTVVKVPADLSLLPRQSLYLQGSLISPAGELVKHGRLTSWIKRCPPILRLTQSGTQPVTSPENFPFPNQKLNLPQNLPSPINPLILTHIDFHKGKLPYNLLHTQIQNSLFFYSAAPFTPTARLSGTEFWLRGIATVTPKLSRNHPNIMNTCVENKNEIHLLDEQRVALYNIYLHSGRTHQIRVHLSESGFPILGDEVYEDFVGKRKKYRTNQYLALQAFKLRFPHPCEHWAWVECEVQMPGDHEYWTPFRDHLKSGDQSPV
ncbi:hypothetical protein G9A89_011867 [Geosiphon pyriformis]|nr:hypothetical protein G9A89_011867 [Geosiphon pyriformis]